MNIEELKQEIQKYFEGTNPCHDFMHTERVKNLALHIGKKENADLEIIEIASLLHDIARKIQDESKGEICHAEQGGIIAREILKSKGLEENKINKIIHCIETHRFRKNNKPESKEAQILYDADKLDSIGAIGLARAISFSGSVGANVHNPNVDIANTKEYSKDDSAYREYLVKLSKIKNELLTEEGKRIAQERHKFMEDFFTRINQEVAGEL